MNKITFTFKKRKKLEVKIKESCLKRCYRFSNNINYIDSLRSGVVKRCPSDLLGIGEKFHGGGER